MGPKKSPRKDLSGVTRGGVDGAQHFEFGIGGQAITGLDFHRPGAQGGHRSEAAKEIHEQFFVAGCPDRLHGGHDAAPGREDFQVLRACHLHFELIQSIARPASVSVTIDKRGHHHASAGINAFAFDFTLEFTGPDGHDSTLRNADVAAFDHVEIPQRHTSARQVDLIWRLARKRQDTSVGDDQCGRSGDGD
jgi:hypothetical protein